ncbi:MULTISPECIES: type III secretion system inner membrane ring subunit SctD [unclassified Hahella]|uniref:type III secretion system inner membrane ring subunit SctD n=1 Tax=unclassified Hahella TaxID=2624107 RepID=UPI001C1EAC29|nr:MULTISPECIES: type III secretion system inner membrane ring subunit SctD [unclassified Hahella]MBU6949827.1 type III secretion system inner membrane ring subunit SctD [Hahella sp. HN01]MDG9668380.1 type III secretion system inner membrane ring subunit SctD [Hahella sp. CR1]
MSDWKLKILSGAHAGSELDLVVGKYVCGGDDNDDLVFQEPNLLAAHFSLQVEEQQIRLTLLQEGSRLLLNGEVSEQRDLVVEEVTPVAVDDFQFAVANGPAEWPQPVVPAAPAAQPKPASGAAAADAPASAPTTPLPSRSWSETFNRMKVGLGVMGACAGLLMMLAVGSMSNAEKSKEGVVAADRANLQSELSQTLGLPNVKVLALADGMSWLVEGYVNDAGELNRLARWLESKNLQATLKVKVTDELIKGAEIALTALGYSNVSVFKGDRPGFLVLKGNVDDDVAWKKNRGRLQVDVPGVIGFEDMVTADTKMALAPLPNLVVKGIYMGKTPFFVLSNGEKYFVGSQLNYGYRVEEITPHMLQLRRGDKLIQYRLGVD